MSVATLEVPPRTVSASPQATGALALALQEAFTVAIRLRANRQVAADADAFRSHIKQLLAVADQEARRIGYSGDSVKRAIYAYIAFLDESVLNSQQAMFASWPRQPLQEEVFGDHVAGETFFRQLDDLLSQQDSPELADVLEVYQLCMLLGFRGRYAVAGGSGLQGSLTAVQHKILRIRGPSAGLAPAWALPTGEAQATARDPWVPRLVVIGAVLAVLVVGLYLVFRLWLGADLAALQTLALPAVP